MQTESLERAKAKRGRRESVKRPGPSRRRQTRVLPVDPHESAALAHCRYVKDRTPGISRIRSGRGFRYVGPDKAAVTDKPTLERIRALVIPPAWRDVWICPSADGHIQATGWDARGRKQYRYHARFRQIREETKYERMLAFADALPEIRAGVDGHLAHPKLTREKILATVVRLLEITLIRIGNEEYARENGSFGLTTMRSRHVDVHGSVVRFHFRGKSGKEHEVAVHDRRVARIVARCNDLPGEELFQYVDESGQRCSIESSDVNEFIRNLAGGDFSAKDFRTWSGTVLAAEELALLNAFESVSAAKRNIVTAIRRVAERLGNTPAVCRRCYVHPQIFDAYLAGDLAEALADSVEAREGDIRLSPRESSVLGLLRRPSAAAPMAHAA